MTTAQSMTACTHPHQNFPVCPAPLFDDYLSRTETSSQDAVEPMESMPQNHQQQQGTEEESGQQQEQLEYSQQQQGERPKRKRCVPKLSENKLTPNAEQSSTNLILRKLPARADEAEIKRVFAPYGEILSAAVMRNIHTGENLGTAFVRYATTEQARAALLECHGKRVFGRTISVHWAKKQHDDTPVGEARKKIFKLFVRNIPLDVTVDELTALFRQYGPVKEISIHKDTAAVADRRLERRIAFVAYLAEGAAERAAECVHNTRPFPSSGSIPLMVKLAEDHQQKRAGNKMPSQIITPEVTSAGRRSSISSNNVTNSSRSSSSYNMCREDSRRHLVMGSVCAQEGDPLHCQSTFLLPPNLISAVLSQERHSVGAVSTQSSRSSSDNINNIAETHVGRQRYMHNPYNAVHSRVYIVAG
ncbi:putative RNA-binding protein [Trypanosoma theileri]|uniref:Putative RNA-binding protein n=1 Tax=Trypanosoma theileri TaxID=67003 RepID=A0A1X0P0Z9_9TRYP|nr:putative RNA-binding protein [Trypanosoma theileri]ORC90199.1 putative RNA-binding protein [Trypanosoma theileri]